MGLNLKYQCMLAHKVDGKHPTSYSDLLLVVWKLESQAGARDPEDHHNWRIKCYPATGIRELVSL